MFRCFGAARGGRVGTWLVSEEGDTAFWSGDQLSTETVGCDKTCLADKIVYVVSVTTRCRKAGPTKSVRVPEAVQQACYDRCSTYYWLLFL